MAWLVKGCGLELVGKVAEYLGRNIWFLQPEGSVSEEDRKVRDLLGAP